MPLEIPWRAKYGTCAVGCGPLISNYISTFENVQLRMKIQNDASTDDNTWRYYNMLRHVYYSLCERVCVAYFFEVMFTGWYRVFISSISAHKTEVNIIRVA